MLKILLIMGLMGGGGYIGRRMSRVYIGRERYFSELALFCGYLISEISFVQLSLASILEKYRDIFKSRLSFHLGRAAGVLSENLPLNTENLRAAIPKPPLKDNEYDIFIQLLDTLGKSDSDTQINAIKNFQASFAAFLEDAQLDKKK